MASTMAARSSSSPRPPAARSRARRRTQRRRAGRAARAPRGVRRRSDRPPGARAARSSALPCLASPCACRPASGRRPSARPSRRPGRCSSAGRPASRRRPGPRSGRNLGRSPRRRRADQGPAVPAGRRSPTPCRAGGRARRASGRLACRLPKADARLQDDAVHPGRRRPRSGTPDCALPHAGSCRPGTRPARPKAPATSAPRLGAIRPSPCQRDSHTATTTCACILAATSPRPPVGNRGCNVVGLRFQASRLPGLDLVAEKRSLTIGDGWKARRGCAALFGSRLDRHMGETCLLQLATDQRLIVVAVRRARQEARRIVRKELRERLRHFIRKNVLLDAIPYVEQEASSWLQDSPCFAVASCAVGKEHRAELAANEIEGCIFKRQRQGIRLPPRDPGVGRLLRCGVVDHRLVEVGRDIARARWQSWRQGPGDNPTARGGFQNGARRQGRDASRHIHRVRLEDQRNHIAVVVFRNRAGEHLVSFQHGLSPVTA